MFADRGIVNLMDNCTIRTLLEGDVASLGSCNTSSRTRSRRAIATSGDKTRGWSLGGRDTALVEKSNFPGMLLVPKWDHGLSSSSFSFHCCSLEGVTQERNRLSGALSAPFFGRVLLYRKNGIDDVCRPSAARLQRRTPTIDRHYCCLRH